MISNLISVEIFKGNPQAKEIIQRYLDKGYTCLGAIEYKHFSVYYFDKD